MRTCSLPKLALRATPLICTPARSAPTAGREGAAKAVAAIAREAAIGGATMPTGLSLISGCQSAVGTRT